MKFQRLTLKYNKVKFLKDNFTEGFKGIPYIGEMNELGQPHGYGIMIEFLHSIKEAQFKNGRIHGKCKALYTQVYHYFSDEDDYYEAVSIEEDDGEYF